MVEIPPLRTLDKHAEAQLIDKLWHEPGSKFEVRYQDEGYGKSPVYTDIWDSTDYPGIAIALILIDTRCQYAGRFTYIDETWKGEGQRYMQAFDGGGDFKVVRRYLITSDYSEEKKPPSMLAAACCRFIADIFDPDAGLCRIDFCD